MAESAPWEDFAAPTEKKNDLPPSIKTTVEPSVAKTPEITTPEPKVDKYIRVDQDAAPEPAPKAPVEGPVIPTAPPPVDKFPDQYYITNREPGFIDKVWDVARKSGFPVDRMQRDLQTADDLIRMTARGVTFGWADKMMANPEVEKQRTELAAKNTGTAGQIAEGAGQMMSSAALMGAAPAAMGVKEGMGIGAKMMATTASNAGLGALEAAGKDESVGRGAVAGAVGGAAGMAAAGLAKAGMRYLNRAQGIEAPSIKELATKADDLFKQADDQGVMVKQGAWNDGVNGVIQAARDMNYDPRIHRQARVVMKAFEDLRGRPMTMSQIEAQRKFLNNAISNTPRDQESTRAVMFEMKDKLDDWASKLTAKDVIQSGTSAAGGAVPAVKLFKEGRNTWAQRQKLETIERAFEQADNSNQPYDAALTTALRRVANAKNFKTRWTKGEQKAILDIVRSDTVTKLMSGLGRLGGLSVGPAGLGGSIGYAVGGVPGGIMGGLVGGAGAAAAQNLSGRAARAAAGDLGYSVATGMPNPGVSQAGTLGRLIGMTGARDTMGDVLEPTKIGPWSE